MLMLVFVTRLKLLSSKQSMSEGKFGSKARQSLWSLVVFFGLSGEQRQFLSSLCLEQQL